ncbi:MAG: hypothetical protein EZS28_016580 [Streblomastix strix]|uniref:Uncharacterized protein n=1 Tax=Streblomastix strix TaxID=222440 RepID=A0A5J4W091_9EUKA|nr:MAG: hypothetical protein EZS28_016580 [Streblomastix strix]
MAICLIWRESNLSAYDPMHSMHSMHMDNSHHLSTPLIIFIVLHIQTYPIVHPFILNIIFVISGSGFLLPTTIMRKDKVNRLGETYKKRLQKVRQITSIFDLRDISSKLMSTASKGLLAVLSQIQ